MDNKLTSLNELLKESSLPRYDLREQAFRRYERYIAMACSEMVFILDLKKEFERAGRRAPSPRTFALRFRDAIIGYLTYHYESDTIPANATGYLDKIRVEELDGGRVRILNPGRELMLTMDKNTYSATQQDRVIELFEKLHDRTLDGKFYVRYDSPEQLKWLLSLNDKYDVSVKIEGDQLISVI